MAEAKTEQAGEVLNWTADTTYTKGDVVQVADGRAGIVQNDATVGIQVAVDVTKGLIVRVPKTLTMVMLTGSKLFWDHSANKAHLLHGGDRDFYLGTAMSEDLAGSGTTILVALNQEPVYTVSLRDGYSTLKIQTAGFPLASSMGPDGFNMGFSAAAEAQKVDALSARSCSVTALGNSIVEALVDVQVVAGAAVDLNIGVANGTHATDFDSVTEALVVHMDGGDTKINLASRDGTTTVASTDTTVTWTTLVPFLVQWDCRNLADIQVYVNGVNVLPASVFKMNAASGPLHFIAHMEKTADAALASAGLVYGGIRTAQDI